MSVPSGRYAASAGTGPVGRIESYFPAWNNLYDSTHVDWVSLLAGNFIPDYTIPPAAWPPVMSTNYMVGYIAGDVTIPSGQRRGLLVVTGNVRLESGAHWDGIILAGGNLTVPSGLGYFLHGMVVTGLNGASVPADTLPRTGASQPSVQWTWCYTQSSVNSLSALVPITNAWADTWTTY